MKNITVLGSTGSVGTQTLEVVRTHAEDFRITALTAGHNMKLFRQQLSEFDPVFAAVAEQKDMDTLAAEFPHIQFAWGMEGIIQAALISESDIVVNSLLGMMGIRPTYEAVKAGKNIAFANKETIVAGGSIIMPAVRESGIDFLPVDSEHSAIFQALQGSAGNSIKRIILTASGGPFRGYTAEQMKNVTKAQALNHPRWSMGAKITIDSATMMNKGLEIIEASWLFDVPSSKIQAVVHPESVLHSAVEFEDGSIIGQLGVPDMKTPIAYALSWPARLPNVSNSLDLFELGTMHFQKPDLKAFRCLELAYKAIEAGGSYTAVLNAANERAVQAFLNDEIEFRQIADVVDSCLQIHDGRRLCTVDDILQLEKKTEANARGFIEALKG